MSMFIKEKVNLFLCFSFVVVVVFLSASSSLAKKIEISIGSYDPPLDLSLSKTNGNFASTNVKAQIFKKIVEGKSNGRISVKIFPNGQLGGDREAFEMVKLGSLQASAYPGNMLSAFVPEVTVLDIPYLFKDANVAFKVLEGDFGAEMADIVLKKTGVRIIQWGIDGPYENIFTKKKQVKVPSDLKGIKIRVANNPPYVAAIKFAGGSPVPIDWAEVYTSLQQGVIDGLVTGLPYAADIKAEEIVKYVTIAKPYCALSSFFFNESFFQSLSEDDKQLILEAGHKAMRVYSGLQLWGAELWAEYYESKGLTVYHPTPAEMQKWESSIKEPMIKWVEEKVGKEWIVKLQKAVEKAEQELYSD